MRETFPKLPLPLKKHMNVPYLDKEITIDYDDKSYAPTAHTTLLFMNSLEILPEDTYGAVIGTGSGLDAIALSRKGMPNVIATDIDIYTLSVAQHNADVNGVSNIQFVAGDMFIPLNQYKDKGIVFDCIVASPPCMPIPQDQTENFPLYIQGGEDGTTYLERAIIEAKQYLQKEGRLYINFGSTSNPQKLFSELDSYYNWKELAKIKLPFSEQFLQLWPYLLELKKQGKAEFWEESGVPYRWYYQIVAEPK